MAKKRRLKIEQYIPDGPSVAFVVVAPCPGENYYHGKIRDAIVGDEPEFTVRVPKSKRAKFITPLDFAAACAGELNEGRGYVFVTRYRDGVPDLTAAYVSTATGVLCVASSKGDEAPVTHPAVLDPTGWKDKMRQAIAAARQRRAVANGGA